MRFLKRAIEPGFDFTIALAGDQLMHGTVSANKGGADTFSGLSSSLKTKVEIRRFSRVSSLIGPQIFPRVDPGLVFRSPSEGVNPPECGRHPIRIRTN